jgi:hypothetical protein
MELLYKHSSKLLLILLRNQKFGKDIWTQEGLKKNLEQLMGIQTNPYVLSPVIFLKKNEAGWTCNTQYILQKYKVLVRKPKFKFQARICN